MGLLDNPILKPTECSPEEIEELRASLETAADDIKNRKFKTAVDNLFNIDTKLWKEHKILPDFYMDLEWEDKDEMAFINRILRAEYTDSWEEYLELLQVMGDSGYLQQITRHWSGIAPSFLAGLIEALIMRGKIEHAEIFCTHAAILVDPGMVLEALGLSKKYREQLEAKTKEFEDKLRQLKKEDKLDMEKAQRTVEENLRKYAKQGEDDNLIARIQGLSDTNRYIVSGEAFIDFCNRASLKGVDLSGPCLYYFKAIESFLPSRLVEILKPDARITYRDSRGYIEIEPRDPYFESMRIVEYQYIIQEILREKVPFSRSVIDSLARWRHDFRNSRVHREPVESFDEVMKIRGACYDLLGSLFSALKVENVKVNYAK